MPLKKACYDVHCYATITNLNLRTNISIFRIEETVCGDDKTGIKLQNNAKESSETNLASAEGQLEGDETHM